MKVNKIKKQFYPLIRNNVEEIIGNWIKDYQETTTKFYNLTDELFVSVNKSQTNMFQLLDIWRNLGKIFADYLTWLKSLDFTTNNFFSRSFLESWETNFSKRLETFPEHIKIEFDDNTVKLQTSDSLKLKIWKWGKRRQNNLKAISNKITNKTRSVFRKPTIDFSQPHRRFNLHWFLQDFIKIPTANYLCIEWQKFLQFAATQLYDIHVETEEMKNKSLFAMGSISECQNLNPDAIDSILRDLNQHHQSITAIIERTEDYVPISLQRLDDYWKETLSRVESSFALAGTAVLSNRNFTQKRIDNELKNIDSRYKNSRKSWLEHFKSEVEEWEKDVELSILQLQTAQICSTVKSSIEQKLEQELLPSFSKGKDIFSGPLEYLQNLKPASKTELRKIINTEKNTLIKTLRQEILPIMIDTLSAIHFDSILEDYIDQIQDALKMCSERHCVFSFRDLENLVPQSKIDEVAFQTILYNEFFPPVIKKHNLIVTELKQQLDEIFRDISEIDQIVEYNLDTASSLLRNKDVDEVLIEARTNAFEGIKRADNQINTLVEKVTNITQLINENVMQISFDFVESIQALENNEKILQLKVAFTREEAKKRIIEFINISWKNIKVKSFVGGVFFRKVFQKLRGEYFRIRKITGLAPTETEIEEKLAFFLTDTQKHIASLPFVYQRLFKIESLSDERFLAARVYELRSLENVFRTWSADQLITTAVIGEKGSGKTTLINFAIKRSLIEKNIIKIDLNNTTISSEQELCEQLKNGLDINVENMDELESKLLEAEQRICIIENIQNIFLRTVDGFDALERFLLLITRTNKIHCWMVTCTLYSWRYLDKVLNISKYFQNRLELGAFSRGEIENLILKRHRISGYKLRFEGPVHVLRSRKFKKLASFEKQQAYLQDMFFEQLNQFAVGNVSVAMLFWLRAIQTISKDTLVLPSNLELDYSFLYQLTADELFTLAALLYHESLTVEEHARVFNQSINQSQLLLNRMGNRGILIKQSDRFCTHHLLYRPVVRVLKTNNII